MKTSRFKYEYRRSASKLHRTVGDLLREVFPLHKIYQEYPVSRVNIHYKNNRHHFDWVIPSLNLVIEVHGKQHYNVVEWGGKSPTSFEEAQEAFKAGQSRDEQKKEAALAANYTYVVIPYTDSTKISQEYLIEKIRIAEEELVRYTELSDGINVFESQANEANQAKEEAYHQKKLDEAREYRRKQYQRFKEWKKNSA